MRRAFVVRLAPESESARLQFVGWIEEVDTGRERRFRSTEEMLRFLGSCLDEAEGHSSSRNEGGESRPLAEGEK